MKEAAPQANSTTWRKLRRRKGERGGLRADRDEVVRRRERVGKESRERRWGEERQGGKGREERGERREGVMRQGRRAKGEERRERKGGIQFHCEDRSEEEEGERRKRQRDCVELAIGTSSPPDRGRCLL